MIMILTYIHFNYSSERKINPLQNKKNLPRKAGLLHKFVTVYINER